jgi:hypothetical protein
MTTKTIHTTAGSRRATTSRSAPPRSGPGFLHTADAKVEGEYTVKGVKKAFPTAAKKAQLLAAGQEFSEDCKWTDTSKPEDDPDRTGNTSYSVPPAGDHVELVCYGIKDGQKGSLNEGAYQPKKAAPAPSTKEVLEAECWFSLRDRPGFSVDVPSSFSLRYQYIGVIWNVCPPGGPVVARRWHVNFSGSVVADAEGKPVVTFDPPGPGPGPAGGSGGGIPAADPQAPPFGQDNLNGSPLPSAPGEGPVRIEDNTEVDNPSRPPGWWSK